VPRSSAGHPLAKSFYGHGLDRQTVGQLHYDQAMIDWDCTVIDNHLQCGERSRGRLVNYWRPQIVPPALYHSLGKLPEPESTHERDLLRYNLATVRAYLLKEAFRNSALFHG
jgi:hypothetical protein